MPKRKGPFDVEPEWTGRHPRRHPIVLDAEEHGAAGLRHPELGKMLEAERQAGAEYDTRGFAGPPELVSRDCHRLEGEQLPTDWIGVNPSVDRVMWARLLRRAYDRSINGQKPPRILRRLVTSSWMRSERAGVDSDEPVPLVMDEQEALARFASHPLSGALHIVRDAFGDIASYARQVAVAADADGLVLWIEGPDQMVAAARKHHLMPGALWSERAAGTNAIGTSLVLAHPVQIFSAEHFKKAMHGWSSAAAPVHD